jgi:hypothetical protein
MTRVILALGALCLLAACGGKSTTPTTEVTVTATTTVTASPSVSKPAAPAKFGEKLQTKYIQTTVLDYRPRVPNDTDKHRWAAALVKTCAKVDKVGGKQLTFRGSRGTSATDKAGFTMSQVFMALSTLCPPTP